MKISIPVLDKYISTCNTSGATPLFESFKTETTESIKGIDPIVFEAYRDYVNESRIISLFEYNAIKSYSEFLEGEETPEEEEKEEAPAPEATEAPEEEEKEEAPAPEATETPEDEKKEEESEPASAEVSETPEEEKKEEEEEHKEEATEEAKSVDTEVKQAEHGPEDDAKVKEEPATDDEFGIEIDIEEVGKDIDKTFNDIEAEILKLGEPEEHKDSEGEKLVGEEESKKNSDTISEAAAEGGNILIDFLFKRPKVKKLIGKTTELKLKAVQAEIKAQQMVDQKNELLAKKIEDLKAKKANPDQLSRMKEVGKEKIKDFEKTLGKKTDAVDDAVKEIDSQVDELATSAYLQKVVTKARIEREFELAKAKMASADETEQSELKDRMKEKTDQLKEVEDQLNSEESKAEAEKKEIGLDPKEFIALDKINTDLDVIKDKEAVLRKKGDDPKAKEALAQQEEPKHKLWKAGSDILEKIKDKEKKASMYHSLTGKQEINNKAELEDYIDTKAKAGGSAPAASDEKLTKAKNAEGNTKGVYDEAVKDGTDEKRIAGAKVDWLTSKLAVVKIEKKDDAEAINAAQEELNTAKQDLDKLSQKADPVKDFLASEEGKGFSATKPADEELDQYDTKTIKDAEDKDVTLYKKKEAAPVADPVKDFLASEEGKGFSTTKPADEELDQYETKTVKDAEDKDVVLYKKKEATPTVDPVKDFLASEEGKGFSTTKPADEELDQYDTKTIKDAEDKDVILYKKKEATPTQTNASVDNGPISLNTRVYENLTVAQKFRQALNK